jgi:hypothetical protein
LLFLGSVRRGGEDLLLAGGRDGEAIVVAEEEGVREDLLLGGGDVAATL